MRICIFGMGYVGIVSASCLLKDGHEIIGIDPDKNKINDLLEGRSPIQENGVSDLIFKGHSNNLLTVLTEPDDRICDCDMIWICVGTPSREDGSIEYTFVDNVLKSIGKILSGKDHLPLIVVRSTCLPGTMDNRIKPFLEHKIGFDLKLIFHPEFLREGNAVNDFLNPPKIVIGELHEGDSNILLDVYKNIDAQCFNLSFKEAEMVKYCDNIFHALKITFANEMAIISSSLGIDSRRVADVYCSDYKLNISPVYLYPGFAYGGSCLPKDLRAILRFASLNCIQVPMLHGIMKSNKSQIDNFIKRVLSYGPESVGMVGIAFKSDTDDMRESPYVEVAKAMIGEGIKLKIYDQCVYSDRLIGSNKKQVQSAFRNIDSLLVSSLDELSFVDLIIVNHSVVDSSQIKKWVDNNIKIIDIANIKDIDFDSSNYEGIYW